VRTSFNQAEISLNERDVFYEKLRQVGSLVKTIRQLENKAKNPRMKIEQLKQEKEERWGEVYRLHSFSKRW
jgi:hypothetical protein